MSFDEHQPKNSRKDRILQGPHFNGVCQTHVYKWPNRRERAIVGTANEGAK